MAYVPNTTWADGSGGGTPLSAARLNNLEAGLTYEFAYAEFTAPVNISATTEATATTIVTAAAVTFDGSTAVWVEMFAPFWDQVITGQVVNVVLYQDGASIGKIGLVFNSAGGAVAVGTPFRRRLTPAAGSRTYSARAYMSAGTGQAGAGAGGSGNYMPGYIRIVKA